MATLPDLYAAELHDLLHSERRIQQELTTMSGLATSTRLRRAFDDHRAETKAHVERLGFLLEELNGASRSIPAGGVAALIEDGRRRFASVQRGDILDAALIAAAQRIEHYEIASYATARRYAESLGNLDAVRILQQTLDDEKRADRLLTTLAERGITRSARGLRLVERPGRSSSRLRYVAVSNTAGEGQTSELYLRTSEGERLGILDGFMMEADSGRPIYCVIDSRGWLAGRRVVVPVGEVQSNETGTALVTPLTRNALSRYPEFSPSALGGTDPNSALRYEHRLYHAFAPDGEPCDGHPAYENLPAYRAPDQLMAIATAGSRLPAPGFQLSPPDPHLPTSDLRIPIPEPRLPTLEPRIPYPDDRGEPEHHIPDSGDVEPRSTEQPKTTHARIERYRDR